jgi:transposase
MLSTNAPAANVSCRRNLAAKSVRFRVAGWRLDSDTWKVGVGGRPAIPGVGPVLASALVAAVADPKAFRSGRNLAAWIGLTRGSGQRNWEGRT